MTHHPTILSCLGSILPSHILLSLQTSHSCLTLLHYFSRWLLLKLYQEETKTSERDFSLSTNLQIQIIVGLYVLHVFFFFYCIGYSSQSNGDSQKSECIAVNRDVFHIPPKYNACFKAPPRNPTQGFSPGAMQPPPTLDTCSKRSGEDCYGKLVGRGQ